MTIYFGVDFHDRQQVVAWCDTSDGEIRITKLDHTDLEKVRELLCFLRSSDRWAGSLWLQPVVRRIAL